MESMSSRAGDEGTSAARKKLRLSNEQSAFLEEIKKHSTLNPVSILPKDSTFLILSLRAWCMHRKKNLCSYPSAVHPRGASSGARLILSSPSGNGRMHACMMKLKQTDVCA